MPHIEEGKEVLSWTLYDSVTLEAAAISATLFQSPVSGTRTLYDTNMREAGKLPYPDTFEFQGVRMFCEFDNTQTLMTKLLKGVMTLVIGAKPYAEILLWRIPGGCGLHSVMGNQALLTGTPDTFDASVHYAQNGAPDQLSMRTFAIPIKLEPGEVFRVDLAWPVAPTAQKLYISFDGVLRRSIQ